MSRAYITTHGVEWWLDNVEPMKTMGGWARFKERVEKYGYPDTELAELYGRTRQTISDWRIRGGLKQPRRSVSNG